MEKNKVSKNLNFNYEEEIFCSYHKIRKEYRKKVIKFLPYLSTLIIIIFIHFILIYSVYQIPEISAAIAGLTLYSFNLTINWTVFSIVAFTFFYLSKIAFMRFTPFLKKQIEIDIGALGFHIKKKRKSWILFLILNSFSILILFLIELDIIIFNNPTLNTLFNGILITYLFLSISIPILWRFSYDGLVIVLKDKYSISINPYYKIRKTKKNNSKLIGLYLTSNKIATKFNKTKKKIYKRIAEERWLPRKTKNIISKYGLSPFLRFYEFSTPSNFQRQFLNIVLALQEWDLQQKRNF